MMRQLGKQKRLDRLFNTHSRCFIVPIDDLLITGADYQLLQYKEKIPLIADLPIDAVLGFPGVFNQFYKELHNKSWILNLTTSTFRSEHTYKRLSLSLENAILVGCDAVAVHVNITDDNEGIMIQNLASTSCECQKYGIPLMAIIYVRNLDAEGNDNNYLDLKRDNNSEYTRMVAHACRVAVELGADIIKTNYTGSTDSFSNVIYAVGNVPVVIAGGEEVTESEALSNIQGALEAGASGICFGRNFFYRDNLISFSKKVRKLLDENT